MPSNMIIFLFRSLPLSPSRYKGDFIVAIAHQTCYFLFWNRYETLPINWMLETKMNTKIYPQMGQNLRLFIWAASIDITSRSSVSSQNKISKTRRNVWLITIILEMNYKYFLFSVCFNCVCFCLSFCFWQYKLLMFLWPVWYFVLCSFYNEMVEHLPLCVKKKKRTTSTSVLWTWRNGHVHWARVISALWKGKQEKKRKF